MYRGDLIRFVTGNRHEPYGHRSGVFRAAYGVWRADKLTGPDREELRSLLDWFETHLTRPERFAASRHSHGRATGISWIRSTALEYVKRLRRLSSLVEAAGIAVHELRTRRPGYVLYQDAHQVVALPFADTPR